MPYRHIVLFTLKDPSENNIQTAAEKLRSLLGQVEGLLSAEVEADALRSERSCDLCLNMLFASRAALDTYRKHPAHIPVQQHMHAVRSGSHSADYPITRPNRRMPRLLASLGPACGSLYTLRKMLDAGMNGARLSLAHQPMAEASAWIETYATAAAQHGVSPYVIVDVDPERSLPPQIQNAGVHGLVQTGPANPESLRALRETSGKGFRLYAAISQPTTIESLPAILPYADELLVARRAMGRELPMQEIPIMQKRIAKIAAGAGVPFVVASDLLSSMLEHPVPYAAEMLDIYNAVQDGASSLLLTLETSIGKYPVEAMEMLRKAAEAAILT